MMWELAGLSLSQDSLKKSWEGAVSTIAKDECARAFRWWMKLFKNLVRSSGDYCMIKNNPTLVLF
jgi:hypothetical protein